MDKKYLAQIIATDNEGLQMISACTAGAKVKVADIKYLASNKVFLLSIERTKIETDQEDKKINSICRFDCVDKVKSKNIDQKNDDLALNLIAIDYLKNLDMHTVEEHESNLLAKMIERLKLLEGVRLIGTAKEKIAVQSFIIQDIHSHDIGTILDHQGIAIRTGHHCAMPAMEFFGLSGTARASLSVYNNEEDIDRFISGLAKVMEIFS